MFCPKCQNEINDDINYCPYCGYQIKRCPSCQQIVQEGDRFCSSCGTSLYERPQDHIGGYYQPLDHDEPPLSDEEEIEFRKIPVNKKVNKGVILVSVIILVILTVLSYEYLEHGPSLTQQATQDTLPVQKMTIQGQTSQASLTGNLNQNGEAYFDDEKLYMCNQQGAIVVMDQNLAQQQTLISKKSQYVMVYNDLLYYTNENNYFCQASLDGKDEKILISKAIYYPYIDNGNLYYQLDEDDESLYVYHFQDQKQTKLNDRHSYNINVVENKIYYLSTDGIYCIQKDGQNDEKLLSGEFAGVIYSNDKLNYLSTDGICTYDIQSQETTVLIGNTSQFINMTDQYIFYQSMDGSVIRYELSTQKEKTIYNGKVDAGYIVGDKFIVKTSASLYQQESFTIIMDFDGSQQQRLFLQEQGDYI